MKNFLLALSALALIGVTPALANNGFGSESDTTTSQTQGMSGKPAKDNGNEGTTTTETTTTTTGPKGALKNDKTTPNQTTTTETEITDYPGKNK
ncbi:hypothetical protein [Aestuariivirga sp.]|uniref:hypothetical protein n=1 Tax=Aestuariivirga sp. TaxID=2650926 RepID=UPI00391AC39F